MDSGWKYIFGLLGLVLITVWMGVLTYPEPELHLIACDVGQGDAILATHGKYQILIDGGPNNKVIECLDENMPFWDRTIEVVILTHPQLDHYKGLIEVFERYNVEYFLANNLDSSSQEYQVLRNKVGGSGTKVVNPTTGWEARLGTIHLDIVWPSEEFITRESSLVEGDNSNDILGAYTTKRDPNDFSIVAKLSFGEFDALLTGDIGPDIIDGVLTTGEIGDVEYIKVPHHGSKNGLTTSLLKATDPEVAVISVGKNQWGHPHKEVLDMLDEYDVLVFRTEEGKKVEVITDGQTWTVK